jgi:hypothetical protein
LGKSGTLFSTDYSFLLVIMVKILRNGKETGEDSYKAISSDCKSEMMKMASYSKGTRGPFLVESKVARV